MDGKIHNPPDDAKDVYTWYKKAQIDYTQLYIQMYIAYNAWYRQTAKTTNDREAISSLKKRFVIWDDYCKGKTLQSLKPYMDRLSKVTLKDPFLSHPLWNGVVIDTHDWRSLIEYWYQVRCRVMHGSDVSPKYIWLAYETLDIFMSEIVERMQACFTNDDLNRLKEVSILANTPIDTQSRFRKLQQRLQAKYIESPDIWQVDMQRVDINEQD